jgi:hypothetical protein
VNKQEASRMFEAESVIEMLAGRARGAEGSADRRELVSVSVGDS